MAKWGKVDFKELKALQQRLEQLEQADWDKACRQASKKIAAMLLNKVIKRTPVGVKPDLSHLDDQPNTVEVTGKYGTTGTFLSGAGYAREYWSGYTGGTLRRGWLSKTEEEARSGGGAKSVQGLVDQIQIVESGNTYQIIVENPVSYASYVEYGHRQRPGRYVPALGKSLKESWVDGRYMLTISVQEVQGKAPAVVERALYQCLKEVFQ